MNFAAILMRLARRLMPAERRDWCDAMQSEFPHVDERARRDWAFGCVVAAIKQRFAPMQTGTIRISRGVMAIETLGCFGFATLAWFEFTFGASGLIRLNGETIDKVFLSVPNGAYTLALWYSFCITALVGPVGLYLGGRYALFGRGLGSRAFGWVLIAVPVVGTLAIILANALFVDVGPKPSFALTILCVVMPSIGIAHLVHLARPAPLQVAAAV